MALGVRLIANRELSDAVLRYLQKISSSNTRLAKPSTADVFFVRLYVRSYWSSPWFSACTFNSIYIFSIVGKFFRIWWVYIFILLIRLLMSSEESQSSIHFFFNFPFTSCAALIPNFAIRPESLSTLFWNQYIIHKEGQYVWDHCQVRLSDKTEIVCWLDRLFPSLRLLIWSNQ